jgi:hypothetical protein
MSGPCETRTRSFLTHGSPSAAMITGSSLRGARLHRRALHLFAAYAALRRGECTKRNSRYCSHYRSTEAPHGGRSLGFAARAL